jgi:ketosteroid isomerase-like protein
MSQENVELVRSTFAAITRGDYSGAASGFHDDAVWHNTAEFPGPGSCVGAQAIAEFWATLWEGFEWNSGQSEVDRVAHDANVVVVGVHSVGQTTRSGLPIDVRWAAVFRVRDAKVSQVDVHGNWPKALEAVGLAE